MLPCSQRALIWVLEHVGNFGIRLPPDCFKPLCHRMTGVFKMYAANLNVMLPLLDVQFE